MAKGKSECASNQRLPGSSGGQGAYPRGPVTTRDGSQPRQHLPAGHFGADGLSEGKADGATREMDAYQGPREGESK